MAGDWIKMRCDLDEDPAVIALASLIGLPEDHVIGKLWKLWRWANRQLRDGYAQGVTPEWVDRYLGVTGIAEALVKVGWLRVRTGGVEIPKFDLHNSQTAKERALTAKRVAHNRRSKCNGAPVTAPLPEKRREEKSKQDPPTPPRGEGRAVDSLDRLFDRFWRAYPNKVARVPAARAWDELNVDETLLGEMLAAIEAQKRTDCWKRGKIPKPENWLRDERWRDEVIGEKPKESARDRTERQRRERQARTPDGPTVGLEAVNEILKSKTGGTSCPS